MNTQKSAISEIERATRAMKENRWTDAIADLRTAHERTPGDSEIAGKFGFALSRDERYGEAIRVFDGLHKEHPKDPKWPYMIGYQYYQQKEWARAIQWFDRAVALRPGYVKVLYRKGYAHIALGEEEEAIHALGDCIACWEKKTPQAQELDRSNYGKARFQLGKIYLKKGLALKASRHLKLAAEIHADDHDVLYELGQCYIKTRQLDDALRVLQTADQLKPGTDYILDRLAQTHARKGDYIAAEQVYQRIPERRRRPFVLQHLGVLYLQQGQHQKALPYLEAAARKQPDNHNVHYALGCAQEGCGQLQPANASYGRAVNCRKTKYNREFKEAEEALQRTAARIAALPPLEPEDNSKDNEGVIESYNESRGFGFITGKSEARIFFHISSFVVGKSPAEDCVSRSRPSARPKGFEPYMSSPRSNSSL